MDRESILENQKLLLDTLREGRKLLHENNEAIKQLDERMNEFHEAVARKMVMYDMILSIKNGDNRIDRRVKYLETCVTQFEKYDIGVRLLELDKWRAQFSGARIMWVLVLAALTFLANVGVAIVTLMRTH